MKNTFNIYAAEAGALNLEAKMNRTDLQKVFASSAFNATKNATPAQYKARVGHYIKKILTREIQEAKFAANKAKEESNRRGALGEDGRNREDAYQTALNAAYAEIIETGKARHRRKFKIRQTLRAKFGII